MRRRLRWVASTTILASILISSAAGGVRTPNTVVKSVVGIAGAPNAGAGILANGTAGQPSPIGVSSGSGVVLYGGFWGPHWPGLTDVAPPDAAGLQTGLQAAYPNPFNPQTRVGFTLAATSRVRLDIFDAQGRLVRTLLDEMRPAGRHQAIWNGTDLGGRRVASGLYFYRLRAGDYESVKKMTMVK
jgi:hypothetical protein